jgi:hypothetical protein
MASSSNHQSLNLSPAAHLREKFEQKRQALNVTGLYLGDPTFRDSIDQRIVWQRIGRGDRLVTKVSADALRAAQDGLASRAADGQAEDQEEQANLPELVPAKLSVVVLITPKDYWLDSCGLWKGPTSGCRNFADMKLTCTGAAPMHEVFRSDFKCAFDNLHFLLEKATTPGFTKASGVLVYGTGGVETIKFRHVLFEVSSII